MSVFSPHPVPVEASAWGTVCMCSPACLLRARWGRRHGVPFLPQAMGWGLRFQCWLCCLALRSPGSLLSSGGKELSPCEPQLRRVCGQPPRQGLMCRGSRRVTALVLSGAGSVVLPPATLPSPVTQAVVSTLTPCNRWRGSSEAGAPMGCDACTANVEMLPGLVCVNPLVTLGRPLLLFGLWWWFPPVSPQALTHSDGPQESGQTHCLLSGRRPADLRSSLFPGRCRGEERPRQRLNPRPQMGELCAPRPLPPSPSHTRSHTPSRVVLLSTLSATHRPVRFLL